jgi:hypothetical protein
MSLQDDGEWEPPLIDNPDFKGEWSAKKAASLSIAQHRIASHRIASHRVA